MRNNDDLRTVSRNPGTQDGNRPKDGNLAADGYTVVDRADGSAPRRGLQPDVKRSVAGVPYYNPRGR